MTLSREQIERRQLGVGASEVAAALGLSKWKSPLELYAEKIGDAAPTDDTLAMRFGHAAEPFILDEYERERGVKLIRSPDTLRNGVMLCHLDAWIPGQLVVNAKTARSRVAWGEPGTADVPTDYLLQEHAEMMLAGVGVAHLPVLFFGSAIEVYEVPLDVELADMIKRGVAKFWDHVQRREPPSPTTLAEVNMRWPLSTVRTIELPPNVANEVELLTVCRSKIAEYEADAETAEARLKMFMGDAECATVDGVPTISWRTAKAARVFDAKRFKAEHPEIACEYEVERAPSRRFLVKT